MQPPRAGKAQLSDDVWACITDHLRDDVDDLLALRSSSKYFARTVDLHHASIFVAKFIAAVTQGTLALPRGRHAFRLLDRVHVLAFDVGTHADQQRLRALLPRLPALQCLRLYGGQSAPPLGALPVPPSLQVLSYHAFATLDAAPLVNALPASLEQLLLVDGVLTVDAPVTWPRALTTLVLRDCRLDDAAKLDLAAQHNLIELDLSHNQLLQAPDLELPLHLEQLWLRKNPALAPEVVTATSQIARPYLLHCDLWPAAGPAGR